MATEQLEADFPAIQSAVYRVALSLDAFLVNGIPSGVIHRAAFPHLLDKIASNLLAEVTRLEEEVTYSAPTNQPEVNELLTALRAKCQQLVELVTGLSSFRTLPPHQLRSSIAQVVLLRGESVKVIQELEECLQIPQPFYLSRPAPANAAVNDFLTNLERLFVEER